jgi:RNA polymerase sigma factor (sigma-70 family)
MANGQLHAVVRHVRGLVGAHPADSRSDGALLRAFARREDQAAFTMLVQRHGAMVLAVCRRVLRHLQDAEDAFQATFLLLAQSAADIGRRESAAGWLHEAAYRMAQNARRARMRRRRHEGRAKAMPAANPAWEAAWREVQVVLDEEIERLPAAYREAFVLCCLENKSAAEAARILGVREGTVGSRLARARLRLQKALARRGVRLSAVLTAAALTGGTVSARAPEALIAATTRAAMILAAGNTPAPRVVSATVAELLRKARTTMILTNWKRLALLVLAIGLAGAGTSAYQLGDARSPEAAAAPIEEPPGDISAGTPAVQPQKPAQTGEIVRARGQVLDPDGKPVAGAKVVLHQRRMNQVAAAFFPAPNAATTDADGRFDFSGNVYRNAPMRDLPPLLVLTAHVPGYGPAAVAMESPDELKEYTLRLVKDDVPLRGRILNLEGRPVAGVTVRPITVVANAAGDLDRLIKAAETNTWTDLPNAFKPNLVFSAAAAGLTQTTTTGRDGKFTLSGFGRERIVVLRLDGPTIETCLVNAMTRMGPTVRASRRGHGPRVGGALPSPGRKLHPDPDSYVYALGVPFDFAAGPALVVEGTVRDQDTGKPIAGVVVGHGIAHDFGYAYSWTQEALTTTTDADGHYRLAGLSRTSPGLRFAPPDGQPYFSAGASPPAHEFGKPVQLDVRLQHGVLVKGRVTDRVTGRPVQAVVQYFAFVDNPQLRTVKSFSGSTAVSSKKDGSFTLTALPGRGIVAVQTDEMRRGTYLFGQGADAISCPREARGYFLSRPYICVPGQFNTLVGIDPAEEKGTGPLNAGVLSPFLPIAKAESITCDVQLDPGKTVQGTILDPDGKRLAGASIRGPYLTLKSLRDLPSAEFAIPAVNPSNPEAYFFEHRQRNLAAAVILKGDEKPGFTVKLRPAATITGRLVTEKGEPAGNYFLDGRLETGQLNLTRAYRGFFWVRTDGRGRFKTERLLPGVKFSVSDGRSNLFTNLMLQPGEVRDLGDIKITNLPE